ncbi:hypothetical protein [Tateyamaria sp. ANG-S1]|uniref:hypothetical protein n=1 Tax=Tateyamaria sp. ANG-S1 TaxID=1577905 RepID=UPI00057F1CD0|nr:hypothetical protein [Tateyamaria sp. ANG-S1]KIC51055.1 hypothetical protein RA29_04025 [Tateyamaria sp. ANG-S1]
MMPFEPINAVVFRADVAGVERVRKRVFHALAGDVAFAVAREGWKGFKEALDFGLRLEPAHGIAFEGIAHDIGQGCIGEEHLSPTSNRLIFVPNRRGMNPVPRLHTRLHFLRDLPPVLFAL